LADLKSLMREDLKHGGDDMWLDFGVKQCYDKQRESLEKML